LPERSQPLLADGVGSFPRTREVAETLSPHKPIAEDQCVETMV
jgi:hypothetical protein